MNDRRHLVLSRAVRSLWQNLLARVNGYPRSATMLTFLVALMPMIFLGSYVARHGVEVPHMDDWEIAPVIAKAHTGELSFGDFFTQEEEARMIVPKLIFVASTWRGHWDVRDQMMLSVFICIITAVGIYILLRRSGLTVVGSALCFWAIVLLIFSPTQFELWLFASGFPSFLPVLFIVTAWLLFETRLSTGTKFAGAALLSLMSSFTLAHGLLAWALTFPMYLLGQSVRRWKSWGGAWLALTLACGAIYLSGYRKPAHLPAFAPAISMGDYVSYVLAFLGNSFAYASKNDRVALAIAAGAVVLVLFLACIAYVITQRREQGMFRATLPWLALGLYSLGSASLATLGRVGFGTQYAISSRYVTFSLYLFVAVIALVAIVRRDAFNRSSSRWRVAVPAVSVVLLLVGLGLFAAGFARSMRILDSIWARNRLARSAVLFSGVVDTSGIIKRINYPDPQRVLVRAALLDRLQLLRPALPKSTSVSAIAHQHVDDQTASGWCDSVALAENGTARASGWAALTAKGRPADAVVLAYEMPGQSPVIFAMSDNVTKRPDVVRLLRERRQLWTGWFATFPRDAVPPGAAISAWAVDADGPTLYRLRQNQPELML